MATAVPCAAAEGSRNKAKGHQCAVALSSTRPLGFRGLGFRV